MRSRLGGGLAAVAVATTVVVLPVSAAAIGRQTESTPSATPSPATASTAGKTAGSPTSVSITFESDGTHEYGASVTIIVDLKPTLAYGNVKFYDGSTLLATGHNYRIRWSYQTSTLAVGTHHFTAYFDPTAPGYADSKGKAEYVVRAEPVIPTPTASHSPTPTPTPSKSVDKQPIGGGIPTTPPVHVSAGGGTRSPSATPRPVTSAGGGTRSPMPSKGSLPFTGFDAQRLVIVAGGLIAAGIAFIAVAGRRRRRRPIGAHQ